MLGTLHILLNFSLRTTLWGYFLPHFTEEACKDFFKLLAVVRSLVSVGAYWWGLKGEIMTCKENRS